MKLMHQQGLAAVLLFLLTASCVSCNDGVQGRGIVGTWRCLDREFSDKDWEFRGDGVFDDGEGTGYWSRSGEDRIQLTFNFDGDRQVLDFRYVETSSTLSMTIVQIDGSMPAAKQAIESGKLPNTIVLKRLK